MKLKASSVSQRDTTLCAFWQAKGLPTPDKCEPRWGGPVACPVRPAACRSEEM